MRLRKDKDFNEIPGLELMTSNGFQIPSIIIPDDIGYYIIDQINGKTFKLDLEGNLLDFSSNNGFGLDEINFVKCGINYSTKTDTKLYLGGKGFIEPYIASPHLNYRSVE